MDERIIERKEVGDYRITIWHDWDAESPCVNWDMAARYLFEYNDCGHCLHRECNWRDVWGKYGSNNHSLNDSLRIFIEKNCDFDLLWNYIKSGKMESVRLNYDRSAQEWKLSVYGHWILDGKPTWDVIFEITTYDRKEKCWQTFEDLFNTLETQGLVEILNACGKNIYAKEWSTRGYCQGDYVKGVAYCTKDWYDKRGTGSNGTPWKEHIDRLIDMEVKEIGMWMWGDVIGYSFEKKVRFNKVYEDPDREDEESYDWEDVDSCFGYYMEPEELIEEVMDEHDIKEEDAA